MLRIEKIERQIDEFMLYCETKGLAKKTMSSYEQTLKLFKIFALEKYNVTDANEIKEKMLREYIKYLQERGKYTIVSDLKSIKYNCPDNRADIGKKVSTTTINNYLRNIKVFFNFLEEHNLVKKNDISKVKQLKNKRKQQDFISDNDFDRLLKNIDTSKFHEYRDYVIIQLIFDTGMRVGECLAILVEEVDINNRCIYLQAQNTKGKKDRYVYFSQYMQRELRRWMKYKDRYKDSEYLFCTIRGTKLTVGNYESNFKKYAKRVGLDEAHPHQLRNNFAKRFLMEGGDIYTLSKLLGHSSVTVTEKAYLDLTDDDIR